MDWPIFFPNMKKRSTKDFIIRILTSEKSLSNQKVFNQIKKQFGVSVTYQSVRQALMELMTSGVLSKNGKEYSISHKWIITLYNYSTLLKKKFIDDVDVKIIDKNTKEIYFNSLYEMGHFILYGFKDQFFGVDNKEDLYMLINHLWFPFFNKEKRNLLKQFFSEHNNYVYVASKGLVNKVFSMFYSKYAKVKFGVKFDDFFDIIIQGNCIAKIFMPKELREKMDKAYRTKNILNMKIIDEMSDFSYGQHPIKMIITRNKELADEIKELIQSKNR
jgi:hypothetical protein